MLVVLDTCDRFGPEPRSCEGARRRGRIEDDGTDARGKPSVLHVFVDANTGKVIDTVDYVREGTGTGYYYGNVNLTTSGSGSSFSLTDGTRPGIRCGNQSGTTYRDAKLQLIAGDPNRVRGGMDRVFVSGPGGNCLRISVVMRDFGADRARPVVR